MKHATCAGVFLACLAVVGCGEDEAPDLRPDCRFDTTRCSPGFLCEEISDGSWACIRDTSGPDEGTVDGDESETAG